MSCEVYWRDGIVRVERGEPDPHRDGCTDCQREHRARDAIVRALPLLAGCELGDPDWEAAVWARIARQDAARPHLRWFVGSMVATAVMLVLASWAVLRDRARGARRDDAPVIEVTSGRLLMRAIRPARGSAMATVGDQVTITVKPGDAVRIYHDNDLVLACPGITIGGCVVDARGLTAAARLRTPGAYALVIITPAARREAAPASTRTLASDVAALVDAGYSYQLTQLWVP